MTESHGEERRSFRPGKTAVLGLLLGVALILGYIEALLPPFTGIPGVKLGLANIVTLLTLKLYGRKEALMVLISRILLSGLLFGSLYSILYSLAGGLFAFFLMAFFLHYPKFSLIGVSVLGAIGHNMGQLIVAMLTVKTLKLVYYGPVLLISGLLTGILTGMLAALILKHLRAEDADRLYK